ncbi:hypothetical protein BD324DRAFT_650648 [Kockovaella imperatae]|uniref:Uncharacterized protein n=1 Tax=Kockovaella imperatae TaxID=4999 RepID=A0A1Y1UG62_9TREE|nr:hypothetical protein BD324DRAFT_650648 [Kockovaella imperatae]ORX37033.1 hypothetical protein BD324DRAFT_650648 [Kockovaella imperatae]
MLNVISTPPSRAPRLASLEPYQPRSGTTGVPSAIVSRRRVIGQLVPRAASPIIESSSSQDGDVTSKLDVLIGSIEGVLKGYAVYPSRSPTYFASLRDFHRRALELKAVPVDRDICQGPARTSLAQPEAHGREVDTDLGYHDESLGTANTAQKSSLHESVRSAPSRLPMHRSPSCNSLRPRPPRLPYLNETDPLSKDVRNLAHEWWNSEVAAAWYGPRPGVRSPPKSPVDRQRKKSLEDRGRFGTDGRDRRREEEREKSIKRDSSFVGLYDE